MDTMSATTESEWCRQTGSSAILEYSRMNFDHENTAVKSKMAAPNGETDVKFKTAAPNGESTDDEPKTAAPNIETDVESKMAAPNGESTDDEPKTAAPNGESTDDEPKTAAPNGESTDDEPKTAAPNGETDVKSKMAAPNGESTDDEPKMAAPNGESTVAETCKTAGNALHESMENNFISKNVSFKKKRGNWTSDSYTPLGHNIVSNTVNQQPGYQTAAYKGPSTNISSKTMVEISPRGLVNLGNTCYMNSALQCLSCADDYELCFSPDSTQGFAQTLATLLQQIKKRSGLAVCPDQIKTEIGKHSALFAGFSQQDSQECLSAILEKSHDDMKRSPTLSKMYSPKETTWTTYLQSCGDSNVVEWFQGEQQSTMQCLNEKCNHEIHKCDPVMFLSVSIPSTRSKQTKVQLRDCLDAFSAVEIISDWPCPKCKQSVDVKRFVKIKKAPNTLMIYLKRFKYNCYGERCKVNTPVDFPMMLNLSSYVCGNESDHFYDLIGVINHSGSIHGGHYTAKCRYGNDWYSISDDSVSKCKAEYVNTPGGLEYVLVYQRVKFRSQLRARVHHSVVSDGLRILDKWRASSEID